MKAVRITDVSFDPARALYTGTVTLCGPVPLYDRQVRVIGHRHWSTAQVITALKQKAET